MLPLKYQSTKTLLLSCNIQLKELSRIFLRWARVWQAKFHQQSLCSWIAQWALVFILLNNSITCSVGPCFHPSEQLHVISNLYPSTVDPSFQDHFWPCWWCLSRRRTCGSPASAPLSPHCKGQSLTFCFLAFRQSIQVLYVFQLWPSLLKGFE